MENTLLVALSRQVALQRELDVVANNIANVDTVGFRREAVQFEEYLAPTASMDLFRIQDRRLSFVQDRATFADFQNGPLSTTGNPLDVAIEGDGFFVVETPNGERFTRGGAFKIDTEGRLTTNTGLPVLSDAGPIVIAPEDGQIRIARDGTIATDQGARGRLRIATFDNQSALIKEGDGLFRPGEGQTANAAAPTEIRLAQGALEGSNVRPVLELSRLIELNRAYTSIASQIQRNDELRRTAVERLAEVPT